MASSRYGLKVWLAQDSGSLNGRVDGGVADDHAQGAGQQGAFQRGSSVFQGWVEDEAADGAQSAGTWDEEGVEDGKGDFALGLAGDGRERGGVDEVVGGVEDDEVAPFGGGADESVVAVVGGPGGELDGEVHGGFGGAGERALRPMPGASESTVAHLFEMLALKKNWWVLVVEAHRRPSPSGSVWPGSGLLSAIWGRRSWR